MSPAVNDQVTHFTPRADPDTLVDNPSLILNVENAFADAHPSLLEYLSQLPPPYPPCPVGGPVQGMADTDEKTYKI